MRNGSDPEDLLPLAVLQKKLKCESQIEQTKPYQKSRWREPEAELLNSEIVITCNPSEASREAKQATNPTDFLKLFFDQSLLNHIVEESNRYAQQKNVELKLTLNELYVVLGAFLLSGYGKYPNRRLYWSSDEDVPKLIQNSMRRNRFEMILKYIHFNDNSKLPQEDRLYKLRPLIDTLNENFRKHGGFDEHICIDESMVPYYGKHYAKQFIRGKPIRFGYKNWALCSSSGHMYGFEIYTGKNVNKEKHFGLGGDVVISLLEKVQLPSSQGYKIYMDNYFTGLPLFDYLTKKNVCVTGTIRDNRLEQYPAKTKKYWKDQPRGSFHMFRNDSTIVVQWKDNKTVSVASNFETTEVTNTLRWDRTTRSRKSVPQPKLIANYNKYMGGVDKMDALVAAYRSRFRKKKWYSPLVLYLLDVSVVNAWILMRKLKANHSDSESLLRFRRHIALCFLKSYGTKPLQGKSKVAPRPLHDVRYDNIGHTVIYNETDRRCAHCSKKSQFICEKCNIALHPKFCFKLYHTL